MKVYSNISQICCPEESSRAHGKVREYLAHSGPAESLGKSTYYTSTPGDTQKQANLGNPGLREFKKMTETLVSNQAVILEAFLLKKDYLTGLRRFVVIIGRKLPFQICVC